MNNVTALFDTSMRRPTTYDRCVMDEYYGVLANVLKKRVPTFVAGMDDALIINALRLVGPPYEQSDQYIKRMAENGWSDFTDPVIVVLKEAYNFYLEIYQAAVQAWATCRGVVSPIKDSGEAMCYGSIQGYGYLTPRLSKTAQLLFRDANWIKEHDDKGGILVNWEDVKKLT